MRLIDADALLETLNDYILENLFEGGSVVEKGYIAEGLSAAIVRIKGAATIEPVKHGCWTCIDGCPQCSECSEFITDLPEEDCMLFEYCPHCGAKMDGDKNAID